MTDYQALSKEALIQRILELESALEFLLNEKNSYELLNFPWAGNLGNWHWDITNNIVICNEEKYKALQYSREEVPEKLRYQFFTSKLHPEDLTHVMSNMQRHMKGLSDAYEVEYRIQAKDGSYKWFYDRGKAIKRDENGNALALSGIVFDITEQKQLEFALADQNIQLNELANMDPLIKIWNRRALHNLLDETMITCQHAHIPLCILMLDIDHFKYINDTYGHQIGDEILVQTAEVMKQCLRGTDALGRFGGEEFLILLPGSDLDNSIHIAERIRARVEQNGFSHGIRITISGGLKELKQETMDNFINAADTLMYQAKNNGRNKIMHE